MLIAILMNFLAANGKGLVLLVYLLQIQSHYCDEPVSALDVSVRSQILNLLLELKRDFDLTVLFISHDLSVVEYVCDRIVVMYLGKVMEVANRDDLYRNPLHPYTKALLSAIPIPDPKHKKDRIIIQGDTPSPIDPPKGCRFCTRCSQ